MRLFQQTLLPDPLGPVFAKARTRLKLSLREAARAAGIPEGEALALEEGRPTDPATARLHAVSYARVLGIDPLAIRDSLPPKPVLATPGNRYLANMAHPVSHRRPMERITPILAPLGRAAVYLLLAATLLSLWGMMRQLSRVRSIPWITGNTRPSYYSPR